MKSIFNSVVYLTFALLYFSSCTKEDINTQSYKLQVIDGIKGTPIAGAKVDLSWNLGSRNMDFDSGITDLDGMVELETQVVIDSVNMIIADDEYATEDWIHQNIWAERNGYTYYEIEQGIAMRPFRSKLVPNELITVKMFESVPITIKIVDVPPLRERSLLVWAAWNQFHPAFSFEHTGSSIHILEFGEGDSDISNTNIAHDVDYRIDFILTKYDTIRQELDTLSITPIEFTGDENNPDREIVYEF